MEIQAFEPFQNDRWGGGGGAAAVEGGWIELAIAISGKGKENFYVTDGNIMYLTDASRFLISCVIQHYAPVVGRGRWRNRCIMLIMTLDPSWRQTLRLPPPGIEPGVLRIRDVYPRSRILIFSHPGSWIQNSNNREGWKKISCHNFLCSHKFHKLQIISVLNYWRKKFGPIFKEL